MGPYQHQTCWSVVTQWQIGNSGKNKLISCPELPRICKATAEQVSSNLVVGAEQMNRTTKKTNILTVWESWQSLFTCSAAMCGCAQCTCQGSTRTVQSWGRPPETSANTGWHSYPCWLCHRAVPLCDASSLGKKKVTSLGQAVKSLLMRKQSLTFRERSTTKFHYLFVHSSYWILPSCCSVVAFTCAGRSSVCRRLS